MKKAGSIGFERPTTDKKTEEALDNLFDDEEKSPETPAKGQGSDLRAETPAKSGKTPSKGQKTPIKADDGKSRQASEPTAHAAEPVLDINQIINAEVEEDGWVTRNFRIRRSHMNKIKSLTAKANSLGKRSTQDDIINEIFADWFRIKNQ